MTEFIGKTFFGRRVIGVRGDDGSMILAVADDDDDDDDDDSPAFSLDAASAVRLAEWIEATDKVRKP